MLKSDLPPKIKKENGVYICGEEIVRQDFMANLLIMDTIDFNGENSSTLVDEIAVWHRSLSPDEIRKMQQLSQEKMETMSPEEMQNVAKVMGEMGMMSPQEQAMMQEVMSRSQEIEAMSPEERKEFFRQLENEYGLGPGHHVVTIDGDENPSERNFPGRNYPGGSPGHDPYPGVS